MLLMEDVRAYMHAHPQSELHRRGKMFGVLVAVRKREDYSEHNDIVVLRAFSAMLDGSYYHPGFIEPVYDAAGIVGLNREDSREKQRQLFANTFLYNARGEKKSLLDIFRDTPPILSVEDYFSPHESRSASRQPLPPSGAGECCAPKLLQAAYLQGLHPLCIAEFWMGAAPKDELRIEGRFYPACSGKCRPILSFTLQGLDVAPDPVYSAGQELAKKSEILYEDDYLIAVNKPAGLLSVPGKEGQYSLLEYLSSHSDSGPTSSSPQDGPTSVFPVHRLDQDTSGVILFAKSREVATQLQQVFLRRDIHKKYIAELTPLNLAIQQLNGSLAAAKPSTGVISLPLLANPLDRPRQMVNFEHGKTAITHYRLTAEKGPHGGPLVELFPETGRTHQLRVHCAHPDGLGLPIYGDRLYGQEAERLMLHAAEIRFPHPAIPDTEISITCPAF